MAVTASVTLSPRERVVQEALEARLEPNELLLSFTQARHNPGGLAEQVYYVGLTQRRFLLVPKDHALRVYSIYRPFIKEVVYNRAGLFQRSGLKLLLGKDSLLLAAGGVWGQRAEQMAQEFARLLDIPLGLTSAQVLSQVTDLLDLGRLGAASELLRERMSNDPVVEIDPGAAELSRLIQDARLALRVGAGIFGIALVMMLILAVMGMARVGFGIVLAVIALVGLARGQQDQRGLALALALLTAGLNGLMNLVAGSLLDVALWLTFAAAMLLTLTGRPSRQRILLAILIFLLGISGSLALANFVDLPSLNGAISPQAIQFKETAEAAGGAASGDYRDDFSDNQGWAVRAYPDLTSALENGAYAVQVRQPSATFFTFPPVQFLPTAAEFDASIPEPFALAVGTFGVTCNYSADLVASGSVVTPETTQAYYLVEISPARQQFAILRQAGEAVTSLLDPAWQSIHGLAPGANQMRVGVTCGQDEIRLAVNGVDQARAAMNNPAGAGRMGLFVSTWKDSRPEGFKVLFDNARFWKAEGQSQ